MARQQADLMKYRYKNCTSYYMVHQKGAQITIHTEIDDLFTRIDALKARSNAPIDVQYTSDNGKTFRLIGGTLGEKLAAKGVAA